MLRMPIISIIVPVYNVASYLSQCLESAGVLGREDTEVILVNDGSTDKSGEICRDYSVKWGNVSLLEKSNGGLSDARNYGMRAAKGEYIYFLDSDDWLVPGAVEKLYHFAVENNCEIVQGGFYYAHKDYLELDNRYLSETDSAFVLERDDAMQQLIKNNYIKNFAWGKLYKSEIVKKYLFPVDKYYEDSFWQHLIVSECNRYGVIPEPLYYYRQRSDGISGQMSLRSLDLLEGNEARFKFIQQNFPRLTSLMADKLWKSAFTFTRYSYNKEFKDAFNRITFQYSSFFSNKLKSSLVFKLSHYDSKYIRKSFLFLLRVYEYFTVKRTKKISVEFIGE